MEEKTQICKDCGKPMTEIGGIGKTQQVGDFTFDMGNGMKAWRTIGIREIKLYQCPEDKNVALF